MYLSKLRSEGEVLPETLPESITNQVSSMLDITSPGHGIDDATSHPTGYTNRREMVSVDKYSVVVTLIRVSSDSRDAEKVYQDNKEFSKEIKHDFSAIGSATTPRRHLQSVQKRRAKKPIRLQDHVAMELGELHKEDNVLFLLEGDEAALTNVENWREFRKKLCHLNIDLAVRDAGQRHHQCSQKAYGRKVANYGHIERGPIFGLPEVLEASLSRE